MYILPLPYNSAILLSLVRRFWKLENSRNVLRCWLLLARKWISVDLPVTSHLMALCHCVFMCIRLIPSSRTFWLIQTGSPSQRHSSRIYSLEERKSRWLKLLRWLCNFYWRCVLRCIRACCWYCYSSLAFSYCHRRVLKRNMPYWLLIRSSTR